MNKNSLQVIAGLVIVIAGIVSTIHSMTIRSQAIIYWANADVDVSYDATAGAEFGLLGIVCVIVGFVLLGAGLFKPSK
jgi:uncharacterized membrane protein